MPDIAMPNGDVVNFPDNMPEDEIRGMIASKFPDVAPENQGFLAGVGEDVRERSRGAAQIQGMRQRGEITKPEEMYYLAGKSGGGIMKDVLGRVVESGIEEIKGLDEALLGGAGHAGLSRVGGAIGSLPSMGGGTIGEAIPQEIAKIGRAYEGWAEENPRISTALESTANIGLLALPTAKHGENIISSSGNILKRRSKKDLAALPSESVRGQASDLFKLAEEKGGAVKPAFWSSYVDDLKKITPQTELGTVLGGESPVSRAVEALKSVKGKTNSLMAIKEADEILGELAESSVNTFGKYTADGRKFLQIQQALRDKIDTAPSKFFEGGKEGFEAVKEARKYWATSLRLNEIERLMAKAQGAAQPSTVMKNGFRRIRDNPKKMKLFTPEEQFAIKKAARSGTAESFLKLGGSGLVPIIAGSAGAAATGGLSGGLMALPAFGVQQAAKRGAEAIQAGRGVNVLKKISGRVQEAPPLPPLSPDLRMLDAGVRNTFLPAGAVDYSTRQVGSQETLSQKAQRILEMKRKKRLGIKGE